MSWTDERVETLKRMWADGQSASQIAKELGGVTRNAVIGKVHRLGLSNRTNGTPAQQPEEAVEAEAPAEVPAAEEEAAEEPATAEAGDPDQTRSAVVPAGQPLPPQPNGEISPETLASVREIEKLARRLTLMELTERTCKWPVGDPATDDFWFCGLPVLPGKPYCEAHVGVAFQPMSARRDRRR